MVFLRNICLKVFQLTYMFSDIKDVQILEICPVGIKLNI